MDQLREEDGRVQCAECEHWFKSLIGHISRRHGMTADDYRLAHGLARTTALVAAGVSDQLRTQGHRRRDTDPRVLDALNGVGAIRQRQAAFPRAQERRRPSTKAAGRAARTARDEPRWQAALAAAGWASLAEAVEWARTTGVGWAEISRRLGGWSITPLKNRAAREGIPPLPKAMASGAQQLLSAARTHNDTYGTLQGTTGPLAKALASHRFLARQGNQTPLISALDEIDPTWREPRSRNSSH